jgi:hypothetical protein
MEQKNKDLLVIVASLIYCAVFIWIGISIANAQVVGDGFPERAGTTTDVNLCYTDVADDSVKCEIFAAPDIIRDFASPGYIGNSPLDAQRLIEDLPTFGLAKFHYWLFGFETLPHAQKDYARCVGEIRAYQSLLGISPLIDEPGSPLYDTVNSVMHYLVPFEPVQRFYGDLRKPAGIEETKIHAIAAIQSHNITVYHVGLCRQTAENFRAIVKSRFGTN